MCQGPAMRTMVLALLTSVAACAPAVQGVHMGGKFVSEDAIAKVKVCVTTGDEGLASFGEPTSRGRENDFTTYQWMSMTAVSTATGAAGRWQTIQVQVDRSGRVASIVVNPGSMPAPPAACPGDPAKTATTKSDRPAASKAKAR